jgi:beta-carotene ketolase (CrtW type)
LFYFGTYIPHKPPADNLDEVMNWEKSKSSTKTTRLESLLTCFHFDCHLEHHAMPQVPWFELWDVKKTIDE